MRWKQTSYSERLLAQQTTSSPGEREKPLKRGSKKSSQMALPGKLTTRMLHKTNLSEIRENLPMGKNWENFHWEALCSLHKELR